MVQERIHEGTILRRKPEQAFSKIDDEVVMLSQDSGEYYALNPVGSRIWELIENPVSVNEIVKVLENEFDVGHDVCVKETIELLNELDKKTLLVLQ